MELSFELSSGYLSMDKKRFVKDILLGKSDIRSLINRGEKGNRSPKIEKGEDRVKIIFDDAEDIPLGDEYQEFFKDLKSKYGPDLKGKIAVRVICHATYFSVLDLNSDDKVAVY